MWRAISNQGIWCPPLAHGACVYVQVNTLAHKINHPLRKTRREIAHGGGRTKVSVRPSCRSYERRCGPSLPLEACAQALAKQRQQGGSADVAGCVCSVCIAAPPRASSNNSLACALSFGNTQGLWMCSVWRNEGSPFCMGPAQPASSWKRERDEPCCRCEGHLCPRHTLPSWTPGSLCASGQ